MTSTLEQSFLTAWRIFGTDITPTPEHRFHPTRRWRFDFAFPDQRVAVELEGGTWVKGRHSTGRGMSADAEKYNAAVVGGWRVLRFTSDMLRDDPAACISTVVQVLEADRG